MSIKSWITDKLPDYFMKPADSEPVMRWNDARQKVSEDIGTTAVRAVSPDIIWIEPSDFPDEPPSPR